MIYIGEFNEQQVRNGEDRFAVEKKKEETGLKYVKSNFVKKRGKIVGIKFWLMTNEEYYNSNEI